MFMCATLHIQYRHHVCLFLAQLYWMLLCSALCFVFCSLEFCICILHFVFVKFIVCTNVHSFLPNFTGCFLLPLPMAWGQTIPYYPLSCKIVFLHFCIFTRTLIGSSERAFLFFDPEGKKRGKTTIFKTSGKTRIYALARNERGDRARKRKESERKTQLSGAQAVKRCPGQKPVMMNERNKRGWGARKSQAVYLELKLSISRRNGSEGQWVQVSCEAQQCDSKR